jgi:hypothetical protein
MLDSRDLINTIEHECPVSRLALETYLRDRCHLLTLTFTNVREFASPVGAGVMFLTIRPFLQALERMPHCYLKEVTIVAAELQAAVEAFSSGQEYRRPSPYVDRWDRTMTPSGQRDIAENWINFRLDEIVYSVSRVRPDVFRPPAHHLSRLQTQLETDRAALRADRAPAGQHFRNVVRNNAATHRIALPEGREGEFADWVYQDRDICSGLQLNHETYRALMFNYGDIPEAADFSDLAHVAAIPYVDAATLDRRMRDYCVRASAKMVRTGASINYSDRVYRDVADVLQRA